MKVPTIPIPNLAVTTQLPIPNSAKRIQLHLPPHSLHSPAPCLPTAISILPPSPPPPLSSPTTTSTTHTYAQNAARSSQTNASWTSIFESSMIHWWLCRGTMERRRSVLPCSILRRTSCAVTLTAERPLLPNLSVCMLLTCMWSQILNPKEAPTASHRSAQVPKRGASSAPRYEQ